MLVRACAKVVRMGAVDRVGSKMLSTVAGENGLWLPHERAADKFKIQKQDILSLEDYEKERDRLLRHRVATRKLRRIPIGPFASLTFENYDLMWMQIQEMLRIEKGGEAQIADELSAYAPLVPNGRNIPFTLMFEIDDKARRNLVLGQLGNVEETLYIQYGSQKVPAKNASPDVERTTVDGKTSSIHFLSFDLSDDQRMMFRVVDQKVTPVFVGVSHPRYPHAVALNSDLVKSLQSNLIL